MHRAFSDTSVTHGQAQGFALVANLALLLVKPGLVIEVALLVEQSNPMVLTRSATLKGVQPETLDQ